jgi:hypothetical protein
MKIIVEIPDDDCLTCPMSHAACMAYGNLYCELMSKREKLVEKDGKYQRTETCKSQTVAEPRTKSVAEKSDPDYTGAYGVGR